MESKNYKLTPKQEKFVQGLIKGLSQRNAYRQAYNVENMKANSIDVKASNLFANKRVKEYYEDFQAKINENIIKNTSNINRELINKIKKYKNDDQTIIEYIELAIINFLPKESLNEKDIKRIRRRKNLSDNTRYSVLERAGFKCQCCGEKPRKNNNVVLHIDHIVPFSLGGGDNIENLQVLCDKCNISKSNRFYYNHMLDWEQ